MRTETVSPYRHRRRIRALERPDHTAGISSGSRSPQCVHPSVSSHERGKDTDGEPRAIKIRCVLHAHPSNHCPEEAGSIRIARESVRPLLSSHGRRKAFGKERAWNPPSTLLLAAPGTQDQQTRRRDRRRLRETGEPAVPVRARLAPDEVRERDVERVGRSGCGDPWPRSPARPGADREDCPVHGGTPARRRAVQLHAEPHLDVAREGTNRSRTARNTTVAAQKSASAVIQRGRTIAVG